MRKGTTSIMAIIAGTGLLVGILGTFFTFGGRIATVESMAVATDKQTDDIDSRERTLELSVADNRNDVSWIKQALDQNGIRPLRFSTSTK
jgi:hypothetical protein